MHDAERDRAAIRKLMSGGRVQKATWERLTKNGYLLHGDYTAAAHELVTTERAKNRSACSPRNKRSRRELAVHDGHRLFATYFSFGSTSGAVNLLEALCVADRSEATYIQFCRTMSSRTDDTDRAFHWSFRPLVRAYMRMHSWHDKAVNYVYAAAYKDSSVKVGVSEKPYERMRHHGRVKTVLLLLPFMVYRDADYIESCMHNSLDEHREHGEWYHDNVGVCKTLLLWHISARKLWNECTSGQLATGSNASAESGD